MRGERADRRKSWIYLAAVGSEETRREMIKRLKNPIEQISLSVDSFPVKR